jgi:hypothetical protein
MSYVVTVLGDKDPYRFHLTLDSLHSFGALTSAASFPLHTNVLFKRQIYLLLAMDMAKVGGCEGFHTNLNIPSRLPTTSVFR